MVSIESSMNRLESRLQTLVEGSLARLLPYRNWQFELVQAVTNALSAEAKIDRQNKILAPDIFTVFLPSDQAAWFENRPEMADAVLEYLTQAAQEAGFTFRTAPTMRFLPVPEADVQRIQVIAQFSLERSGHTASLSFEPPEATSTSAFFIVDGTQLFNISENIINIGRLEVNHLVIQDGRVSRRHAQLRCVRSEYMIFDLDSSGGTFVNGRRITQCTLHPGDVISLAGVPLVFGTETFDQASQTQEITPSKD